MIDFEEMKERYPRGMIVVQGLVMLIVSTILSLILISPFYFFDNSIEIMVDIFTFPADLLPQPYNFSGMVLILVGLLLIIWANYSLLHIGKISLRNREPMQRPANLIIVGPYKFTRNPIYLGGFVALFGLIIMWSSIVTAFFTILVYIIFRYVFIKKEEIILEEEFGDEYREFKNRVGRWF
ncbi:MAG: methyltransferase family protein [Candidatus Thorarchaeota archaeon]